MSCVKFFLLFCIALRRCLCETRDEELEQKESGEDIQSTPHEGFCVHIYMRHEQALPIASTGMCLHRELQGKREGQIFGTVATGAYIKTAATCG